MEQPHRTQYNQEEEPHNEQKYPHTQYHQDQGWPVSYVHTRDFLHPRYSLLTHD